MGKDAKGKAKGKTRAAKRVKGGNCSAEDQEVKESTDSLRNTLIAEMSSLHRFRQIPTKNLVSNLHWL